MLIYYIAIIVFLLDQFTKFLFTNILEQGQSVAVIKNIFHFTLLNNTGVAFGALKWQRFFILGVSFITILLLLVFKDKIVENKKSNMIFLGFIIGGALGNFVDRCRFAYVVD
ncbi:signal peptidase II, partial [bacterium]|nr:signal peptidase II [bacterium]